MILAGDGHTHIHQKDCLGSPVRGKYDVVLTNFPFSQETDYGSLYGLDTADANPVFLKHVVDACAKGGRIGVVVPEGLLFSENKQCENTRQYVLDNCEVIAVISLSEYVFRPYTGQPTAVLILKKGVPSKGRIWFYEVLEDGFEKTTRKDGRRPVAGADNDLLTLRGLWSEKPDTEKAFVVPVSKIRENGHKLSLCSYRPEMASGQDHWVSLGGTNGCCDVQIGGTPKTKIASYWNGRHAWVTISDMTDRYVTATDRTITDEGVKQSSVKELTKGTVLLSFKLTIGKVSIAGCDLYTNEAIAGITPRDGRVLSEYLYHLLPTINLRKYAQRAAKGWTLNKKKLERIQIPVPSVDEQRAFILRMNALEAGGINLREKASALDQETSEVGQAFVDAMMRGTTFYDENRH